MKAPTSALEMLRYDTVVRLTQIQPTDAAAGDGEVLSGAWVREFGDTCPPGVLYRELCRQVPEWSALAAHEIDNPIEATHLEYLIAEPGTDLSTVPALPAGMSGRFRTVEDLHSAAFRYTKEDPAAEPGAVMFNLFEIDGPAGMEQGFLMD